MNNSLSKNERIKSKKIIQELFSKGSSFYLHPFLVKYSFAENQKKHAVLASVSKRNFKQAVDRNLLKRRIKEAYRLNKSLLSLPESLENHSINLALVYVSKEELSFDFIEKKLILALHRIVKDISEKTPKG